MRTFSLLALAAMIGCGGEEGLDVQDDGARFSGTLGAVRFSSEQVAAETYEVRVQVDGLTLFGVLDTSAGVAELDGFASENGADTQLRQTDRDALRELFQALDKLGQIDGAKLYLRRAVSLWTDMPATKELTFEILAERDRSWTSLCRYMNQYVRTTHDCWDYDDWESRSTSYGYMSMEGAVGGDNNAWYYDGSWHYSEPDHRAGVYIRYNCFGRCGIGCGSDRQFTQDCANHDNCVTMGHDKVSFWCTDEWTSASDDWTFAPSC